MIVVETSVPQSNADDNASIKTLVPIQKIPRYFPALTYLSLPVSVVALVCAILNASFVLGHLNGLFTIVAFVASLPYQVFGILLVWLHSHQIESLLKFAPTARRNIAYSCILSLAWLSSAVMTGWIMWRVLAGREERVCLYDNGPCFGYVFRGRMLVPPVLAFVFSIIEMIIFGAIAVVCFILAKAQARANDAGDALELTPSQESDSNTKVISP